MTKYSVMAQVPSLLAQVPTFLEQIPRSFGAGPILWDGPAPREHTDALFAAQVPRTKSDLRHGWRVSAPNNLGPAPSEGTGTKQSGRLRQEGGTCAKLSYEFWRCVHENAAGKGFRCTHEERTRGCQSPSSPSIARRHPVTCRRRASFPNIPSPASGGLPVQTSRHLPAEGFPSTAARVATEMRAVVWGRRAA